MSNINDSLAHLFSLSGIGWLFIGVALTRLYYWVKIDWWNRHHQSETPRRMRFNSLIILWAMIFIFFAYQGIQQQKTANDLRQLTINTANCQKEFFTALKDRAAANDQTDEWSRRKTEAIANWMHDVTFPPPEMVKKRETRDPVYQQWLWDTTAKYYDLINRADEEQKSALEDRKQHPIPEPECGK